MKRRFASLLALLPVAACDPAPAAPPADAAPADAVTDVAADAPADVAPDANTEAALAFDLDADLADTAHFYDLPYPSDLRLNAANAPDLRGFPFAANARAVVSGLLEVAQQRPRFPVIPVAYFRFTAPLAPQMEATVHPATGAAPVMIVDVDPMSPDRGARVPTVAATLAEDPYTPANVLAVAARPGFVLRAGRRYAVVVMRSLHDAQGRPLARSAAFEALKAATAPAGARAMAAHALYAPLWETLRTAGVSVDDVAAATVFTTGDVVADTAALGDRVVAAHDVTFENLRVAEGDSATRTPRYCQLTATVVMPQFQRGAPPFDTEGLFDLDATGTPRPQTYAQQPNYARVPVVLTLPRRAMPAEGFPLAVYFHGSGGRADSVMHRGTWAPQSATHPCPMGSTDTWNNTTGCFTQYEGPAHVLAARGIAAAGSALPVNPERLPGAGETAYLNLTNLQAFRDTFTTSRYYDTHRLQILEAIVDSLADSRTRHSDRIQGFLDQEEHALRRRIFADWSALCGR
jgi:hypothetical protein